MACDEGIVQRIRELLQDTANVKERRMFGGVCFTLNGNMLCGVVKDEVMIRVGPDQYHEALKTPHAREMDFTGRAMMGYVFIAEPGFGSDASLRRWLDWAGRFVATLPTKMPKLRPESRQPPKRRRTNRTR
jgi:TfoX/Sxy family transcriptional regulator of competence genes